MSSIAELYKVVKYEDQPVETMRGLPHPDILELVDLGLSIIPIERGTKQTPAGLGWKRYQTTAATREQVQTWQRVYADCNWAAVWGSASGNVIAVDIDSPAAFGWCQKQGGFNQRWPVWYTTGRGWQYLFRVPEELADKGVLIPHPNVEFRTSRCYSVLPSSVHPSGKVYQWKRFGAIPFAPEWVLNHLNGVAIQEANTNTPYQRPAQRIAHHHRRRPYDIVGRNPRLLRAHGYQWLWTRVFPEGSRNSAFLSTAILLKAAGLSEDEARCKLDKWRRMHTRPVYSQGEAAMVIKSVYNIAYGVTLKGLHKAYDTNGEQMPEGVALDLVRAFPALRAHRKRQNVPMMETVARVFIALYKHNVMKPTPYSHAQLAQLAHCTESQVATVADFLKVTTTSTYNLKALRIPPGQLIHAFHRWRGYQEDLELIAWRWWRRLHGLLAQLLRYLSDIFDSLSATFTGETVQPTRRLVYAPFSTRGPPE